MAFLRQRQQRIRYVYLADYFKHELTAVIPIVIHNEKPGNVNRMLLIGLIFHLTDHMVRFEGN